LHTAGACFDLLAFQVHVWCAQQQQLLVLLSHVANCSAAMCWHVCSALRTAAVLVGVCKHSTAAFAAAGLLL
jgi:hypothetical protein